MLSAVTVPSQFYLGPAIVEQDKTNEIPVARQLFERLDLEGRLVSLDAWHTQDETARALVLEHGALHAFAPASTTLRNLSLALRTLSD